MALTLVELAPHEWRFLFGPEIEGAYERFDTALEWMQRGDYRAAEERLQAIVSEIPGHIDARHHLAIVLDDFRRPAQALSQWQAAVKAGMAALPATFVFGRDRLEWGWLTNRPFLRAYAALGMMHQRRGMMGEAYTIFRNILDLNPNDNQEIRALAIDSLFELRRPHEVVELCDRLAVHDEDVLFGRALAHHHLGNTREAREAGALAASAYPRVAEELLKTRHTPPPGDGSGYITEGGADQAYEYWRRCGRHWKKLPGALDLLKPPSARKLRIVP
jgi:tetratricopeptide (TPR) repeat protein